ncbi:MAG TPA: PAS domain S-box protein, partial [Caldilineaceae bacterium]|nr:PAS domain S-box protein [Caldilineaceae bacterium]
MAQNVILVVEDEGIVGLDIQRRLTNMGYSVPEVVLMDIRLKGDMDGISAAEHIRRYLDIPVVFLTAYADEDTLRRAKVTEPHGYVLKPFEERELHIAIDMALYKHQMERKLKESERWLSTTMNSISEAIIATDGRGQVILLNPMAIAMTGWPREEAIGRTIGEILSIVDETIGKNGPNLALSLLTKPVNQVVDPTALLISRMGDELPIQYHTAPIRDAADQISGTVIVFRDITEQRRREQ